MVLGYLGWMWNPVSEEYVLILINRTETLSKSNSIWSFTLLPQASVDDKWTDWHLRMYS
jgi:hypothetical protein